MNQIHRIAFRLLTSFLFLCSGFVIVTIGQVTPTPPPTLPPGMTGSNTSDPRANLSAGLYDAGEQALGMRLLQSLKKPDSFQLGTDNPDDPRVEKMLASFGIGDTFRRYQSRFSWILRRAHLPIPTSHSRAITYSSETITALTSTILPIRRMARLVTSMVCPGGQGDPSVYKNLMFMSVESPNGRLDCGTQGFAPNPPRPPGANGAEPSGGAKRSFPRR